MTASVISRYKCHEVDQGKDVDCAAGMWSITLVSNNKTAVSGLSAQDSTPHLQFCSYSLIFYRTSQLRIRVRNRVTHGYPTLNSNFSRRKDYHG